MERPPRIEPLAAAAGLALLMHPLAVRFAEGDSASCTRSTAEVDRSKKAIESALAGAPHWWMAIVR